MVSVLEIHAPQKTVCIMRVRCLHETEHTCLISLSVGCREPPYILLAPLPDKRANAAKRVNTHAALPNLQDRVSVRIKSPVCICLRLHLCGADFIDGLGAHQPEREKEIEGKEKRLHHVKLVI